jgi:hypothetical protein
MITQYRYLKFVNLQLQNEGHKTSIWSCQSRSSDELGKVKWHSGWRQYCYFPTVQAVYSDGCLMDIAGFIRQLMTERSRQPV